MDRDIFRSEGRKHDGWKEKWSAKVREDTASNTQKDVPCFAAKKGWNEVGIQVKQE